MGRRCCCVANCKNNELNSACEFYKFPTAHYKLEQRKKWIAAIRKINNCMWQPKKSDVICSDHFVGKKKLNGEISPVYVPSIFSAVRARNINEAAAVNRHTRFMNHRGGFNNKESTTMDTSEVQPVEKNPQLGYAEVQSDSPTYVDK